MEEESRQRQSRMDKGEPYMSIQPAEDPDGNGINQKAHVDLFSCPSNIHRLKNNYVINSKQCHKTEPNIQYFSKGINSQK